MTTPGNRTLRAFAVNPLKARWLMPTFWTSAVWTSAIWTLGAISCSSPDDDAGRGPSLTETNSGTTETADGDLIAPSTPTDTQVDDSVLIPDVEPTRHSPLDEDCENPVFEVTYRDFSEDHPDFEMQFAGDVVRLQLVEDQLGTDLKPVFKDSVGCPPEHGMPGVCANWMPEEPSINSQETFDQWYRTIDGVNFEFNSSIELEPRESDPNTFFFERGEFFPLSPDDGFGVTPRGHHLGKNFLFTTEIHGEFTYLPGQVFRFRGDDDLWIFVNNRLALDLGSMHNVAEGIIDFDAMAEVLDIRPNNIYRMDIFHAERHTTASNFMFETNIACFVPVNVQAAR